MEDEIEVVVPEVLEDEAVEEAPVEEPENA